MMSKHFYIKGLILITIIVGAAGFGWHRFIIDKIKFNLDKIDGLTYRTVTYSILKNNVVISDVALNLATPYQIEGTIPTIAIAGFSFLDYYHDQSISIAQGRLDQADMTIDIQRASEKTVPDTTNKMEFYFDNLSIANSKINLISGQEQLCQIENFQLRLLQLRVTGSDSITILDYNVHTGSVFLPLTGNPHVARIGRTDYNPKRQSILLENVQYMSPISKINWRKQVGKKQSRFNIVIPSLKISRFDAAQFIRTRDIRIGKIKLSTPIIEVFEDKRFAHCQTCIQMLPMSAFQAYDQPITIDSIQVIGGNIAYLTREKDKSQLGQLDFRQLYISGYHLSNIKKDKKRHPDFLLDAETKIFDNTPLKLHFKFNLSNLKSNYSCQGALGTFPISNLNDFLSPVKNIFVRQGVSRGTTFTINGNKDKSTGSIQFTYDNLRLDLDGKNKITNRILGGLINNLAIRPQNEPGSQFRGGRIYHIHDPSRSIFHSLSHSLQSGIQSSVMSRHLLPVELRE